ncbi:uncharacterized protein LOC130447811 [Diorhabda sublineata]|uniref:uncharacterized protein LOC130447811 n=1 Tax=Diorhabda sublineata TaxID=1163346 RepID=UPI0024E0F0A1|nr:uncharacterized protein LOC130447811 [Diorhabda sublineata]
MLDVEKENRFTSTPIKTISESGALRDVGNVTPNVNDKHWESFLANHRALSARKSKSDRKLRVSLTTPKNQHKKKKDCLFKHEDLMLVSQTSNYFRPFESVDSHIEGFKTETHCSCKKPAATLPISSDDYHYLNRKSYKKLKVIEDLKLPPNKKQKIDHVNDFLHQISYITSPENAGCLPGTSSSAGKPQFLDFEYNKNSNDSSYINNMSLEKIVDELIDASDDKIDEKQDVASDNSSDSGFRSSNTEKSHQFDNNFVCKCNKTIIQIDETYNERCVDDTRFRKRRSSLSTEPKALDKSKEGEFTLRRQKCIRRRKPPSCDKYNIENTPIFNCYLENKEIPSAADTKTNLENSASGGRDFRKCLVFDNSKNDSSIYSESGSTCKSIDIRGTVQIKSYLRQDNLLVKVVCCKDLYRANGEKINAYIKVALEDRLGDSRQKKKSFLQRTAVQADSNRPIFNHTFKFPFNGYDNSKNIHLEAWHRDRNTRTSDFLGCMSFDVKDVIEKGIEGTFKLLPQSIGRNTNLSITQDNMSVNNDVHFEKDVKMCESHSSVDELVCLEDFEGELKRSTSKTVLNEQQKYADENLFLRYLELDPTEGPDASSAATQRKATGNRNGRTPFTCTKKLVRPPKSGFGFSVVWTHPPRIERVEKGLPADKAGILPGDYIIFVDKHNVVVMPEIDILNLIRSFGSQLTLEIFRRNPSKNGSVPSVKRLSTPLATSTALGSTSVLPVALQRRPSTVCSTNTASGEYNRRKLNLPQVTFSTEKPTNNPEDNRKKAMYQLVGKEQQYALGLQFAIARFVSALAERKDLISPLEHRMLFQNSEEILQLTEDLLDHLIQDNELQTHLLVKTYFVKLQEIKTIYKKYCSGIKKADCILANKTKNSNSEFCRFIQIPHIPRRRPDITTFIHKPLEHYRDMLRFLTTIQSCTKPNHDDFSVINELVHQLQLTYREITSESGLMEPSGEGRPLLTVQDLENRLVFTKCKPFVLNKPGRQWIFGGDLARVEGRNVRQYWTLLFSDLLLFAKASRDRVLFVTEDPLPLAQVSDMFFNIRKKDTEFRININPDGKNASSPTVHCGPDLSRTPKRNANRKTVILRAPTTELKAVWQNLLQRQIFQLNSGMDGSSISSPLESPEVPITSSVVTLQSNESLSIRRQVRLDITKQHNPIEKFPNLDPVQSQLDKTPDTPSANISFRSSSESSLYTSEASLLRKQTASPSAILTPSTEAYNDDLSDFGLGDEPWDVSQFDYDMSCLNIDVAIVALYQTCQNLNQTCQNCQNANKEKELRQREMDASIELKCKQLGKGVNSKCNALHLERWIKSQLTDELGSETPDEEKEGLMEEWTKEMLRKRSEELQLIDSEGNIRSADNKEHTKRNDNDCEEITVSENDQSPSKSTTTESQVTVRSSPIVPETVSLCRKCHKTCLSTNGNRNNSNGCDGNENTTSRLDNNPTRDSNHNNENNWQSFMLIGLLANKATNSVKTDPFTCSKVPNISVIPATPESSISTSKHSENSSCQNGYENHNFVADSPDDSPESEDHPYHSLSSSMITLRRFGTVSSLERVTSEEKEDSIDNNVDDNSVDEEDNDDDFNNSTIKHWTLRAGTYVAEKMSFLEKLGEDYKQQYVTRYLTTSDNPVNGEDLQEEEDIWGTPTSGGENEDSLNSPGCEDKQSPNNGSLSSDYGDDTELMMDELLMTPPISGAAMRGLLPRRTLEPLIEEELYETSSTSSIESDSESESPERQESGTGGVADTCCVAEGARQPNGSDLEESKGGTGVRPSIPTTTTTIHRSESYRRIIEAAENEGNEERNDYFFNRFRPAGKFVNIERIPRSRSIKIFEFFNMRKPERRIYETHPEGRHLIKIFESEDPLTDDTHSLNSPKQLSPRRLKDKQLDRRFWKQLSRRRGYKGIVPA